MADYVTFHQNSWNHVYNRFGFRINAFLVISIAWGIYWVHWSIWRSIFSLYVNSHVSSGAFFFLLIVTPFKDFQIDKLTKCQSTYIIFTISALSSISEISFVYIVLKIICFQLKTVTGYVRVPDFPKFIYILIIAAYKL